MARVLAYHLVPPDAFQDVILDDRIVPAIERLSPLRFHKDCDEQIEHIERYYKPVPKTVKSLRELIDLEIVSLEAFQTQEGFEAFQGETKFNCWDFLAGDLENIFLSPMDWMWMPDEGATGLVFDANELIRKGAAVREVDFGVRYEHLLHRLLQKGFRTPGTAQKAILKALEQIRNSALIGEEAFEYLKEATFKGLDPSVRSIEIVWNGELPVSWAEEIWYEGEKTSVSEVSSFEA